MRKLLTLMLAISLLTACDSNPFSKKTSKEETADMDDKDKGKDDTDDRDDRKDNNDDDRDKDDETESNWTSKQRNKWLNECIDAASSNPQARELCSCVLEKIEKKYPDAKDAEKVSETVATKMAKECMAGGGDERVDDGGGDVINPDGDDVSDNVRGGSWTNLQRKQFIQGCATTARKAQGFTSEQANSYCDCMTRKVERKHSFQEEPRMTAADFQTEEWQNAAMDCRSRIDD